MPSSAGFTAHIFCEGRELEEYATVDEGPKKTGCWIASEEGKTFNCNLAWEIDKGGLWSLIILCDGVRLGAVSKANEFKNTTLTFKYAFDGMNYRPLRFSKVEIIESEEKSGALGPMFGSISLEVWRISDIRKSMSQSELPAKSVQQFDRSGPIPEKKKALNDHRISLGDKIVSSSKKATRVQYLDTEPFWTFNFYYRPEAILRAQGQISSTQPSTSSTGLPNQVTLKRQASQDLEQEDEIHSSDDEEVVAAKMHVLSQQLETIRAKKRRKIVKREPSPIVIPDGDNEIIELSD